MRKVDPMQTSRAASWQLYRNAPMPMVTIFKTLDITNLLRLKARGWRLNMLLCFCIAQAADRTPAFRLLPVGEDLVEYDGIGVNVIVLNQNGGLSTCDLPFSETLADFDRTYRELTEQVRRTCRDHELTDRMIVGTSSLVRYDVDGAVNMYSGIFNNPFLIWGKFRTEGDRSTLRLSFQFHHVQMDGLEACAFLECLQACVDGLDA